MKHFIPAADFNAFHISANTTIAILNIHLFIEKSFYNTGYVMPTHSRLAKYNIILTIQEASSIFTYSKMHLESINKSCNNLCNDCIAKLLDTNYKILGYISVCSNKIPKYIEISRNKQEDTASIIQKIRDDITTMLSYLNLYLDEARNCSQRILDTIYNHQHQETAPDM